MLLANCQVLFAGGPHSGVLISLDCLPKESLIVPAEPKWRDLPQADRMRPTAGLAAAYTRDGTRMASGPVDNPLVWRYRFVSYRAPFVGEQNLPKVVHPESAAAR
jgi:hypothetical protein